MNMQNTPLILCIILRQLPIGFYENTPTCLNKWVQKWIDGCKQKGFKKGKSKELPFRFYETLHHQKSALKPFAHSHLKNFIAINEQITAITVIAIMGNMALSIGKPSVADFRILIPCVNGSILTTFCIAVGITS